MEGPSLVILRQELSAFKGQRIIEVSGNTKINQSTLLLKKIRSIKSWGKNLVICFDRFFLRIHFLMFGSYRINERKDSPPRLSLRFRNGEFNMYNCSVKIEEKKFSEVFDETVDVLSPAWNTRKAVTALKKQVGRPVCDVLLDQRIFAGVGNIIKNEVLFNQRLHPESFSDKLTLKQRKLLVEEVLVYCWNFYSWKKKFELKKHWLVYKKKICVRCDIPLVRTYCGFPSRLTFYCSRCQTIHH